MAAGKTYGENFLILLSNQDGDHYVLINDQPSISYYANFRPENIPGAGSLWVQKRLWRDRNISQSSGLPQKVAIDHILKTHGRLVEDDRETDAGRKYFIKLMKKCVLNGYRIGLIDTVENHHDYKPDDLSVDEWLESINHAWGESQMHLRFSCFICRSTITECYDSFMEGTDMILSMYPSTV